MAALADPRVRARATDIAAVTGVLAFTVLQLVLGGGFGDFSDVTNELDGASLALAVASALALLWRDRRPLAVLCATIALSLALAALSYGVSTPLAPAVALYACAVRPRHGRSWPVPGVAAAGLAGLVLIEAGLTPYGLPDYLLPGFVWAGAWLIGDRRRVVEARIADQVDHARQEHELAVAQERARIARELHDSAGHALNTILVQAGAARVLRERDRERSAQAVATIEDLARETIEEIDRIVGLLRDDREPDLAPLPGIEQIPALVDRQRAGGLHIDLTIDGQLDPPPPAPVSRAAYRIAQESLTNASRHGAGSTVIALTVGTDDVRLRVANPVADDHAPQPGGGRGITGMRERAKLLGGSLRAERHGSRFELQARLPYGPEPR